MGGGDWRLKSQSKRDWVGGSNHSVRSGNRYFLPRKFRGDVKSSQSLDIICDRGIDRYHSGWLGEEALIHRAARGLYTVFSLFLPAINWISRRCRRREKGTDGEGKEISLPPPPPPSPSFPSCLIQRLLAFWEEIFIPLTVFFMPWLTMNDHSARKCDAPCFPGLRLLHRLSDLSISSCTSIPSFIIKGAPNVVIETVYKYIL